MSKSKGKARAKANKKARLKRKNDFFERRKRVLSSIRKWDDEILTKKCEKVEEWEDVSAVIQELKTVLRVSRNGVGLAASQLSHLKAVVAIRPDVKKNDIRILINPEIIEKGEETAEIKEGCLSYPSFYTKTRRHTKIKVSYWDEDKKKHEEEFTGTEAVIVQHEYDHTIGICLVRTAWEKVKNNKG